ncbi:MAG: histone deacetylase [Desulfobacteraceae bacterium]|nr:MAG: histone deacetylase [Desulfobacteraceae bacterium]
MKKTGFLYDEAYLLHDTGPYHPEVAERLTCVYNGIKEAGLLPNLKLLKGIPAEMKWIETVHDLSYVRRFEELCFAGKKMLDYPDNQMCTYTYETALLAVGGILSAADYVMKGELDNVFCAVRPPGHHAEKNKAMGFCYFNNVAIAAKYIQQKWGINKVMIVDFDVHHGNGTQHIFEQDPTVFYYSIHQHPSFAYPGTGREFEYGTGAGYGFTKNSLALPGWGDEDYKRLIENDLFPAFERFEPEAVIVSTGFDAHVDDDMSDIKISTEGFSWIMKRIFDLTEKHANGKLISVLEGGYSLARLPELAKNHVEILLNIKN